MPSNKVCGVPIAGNWPVDPQEDQPISEDRIWIDGCFDFAHHGHAGAMLQARRLGKELLVGVHSDEEIMDNKGPTVMMLKERVAAVDACRWSTKSIPCAPYVTSLSWISHYGCHYVVHGDDITSDSNGNDCYRYVKEAGRFLVVKRTPGISTTDLVGRMLLCTKNHFIKSLEHVLNGQEGSGNAEECKRVGEEMSQRIRDYATDQTGWKPGCKVFSWSGSNSAMEGNLGVEGGTSRLIVDGRDPQLGQRIVYLDGGFDLFSSGHIEFLRQVVATEESTGLKDGRHNGLSSQYSPAYIIAGIHDDTVINHWKGLNYPIMNIFERGLCVLQCRYIDCVIFSAPFIPSIAYLSNLPFGRPDVVYHGPTSFMPLTYDPYIEVKRLGIYQQIGEHDFQDVNAGEIVQRILKSRAMYEARQRAKGDKAVTEEAALMREAIEEGARNLAKEMTVVR
ncbi:MAG: hypothetical protein Q9217_000912 [Psora testacea]